MKNIALVPGVLGFKSLFGVHYFNGVADHLNTVFEGLVQTIDFTTDSLGTVEDRARKLGAQIKSNFGTEDVYIFAHSMGGLDARFLVAKHLTPEAEQVKSITAIGTPHKGSPIATILDRFNPIENLLNLMPGRLKNKLNAVHDLAETEATQFNNQCPDQPGVVYREIVGISRGGEKPTSTFFRPFFKIVSKHRGLNDGVVPVTSATRPDRDPPLDRWEADHADMVGHDLDRGPTGKPDFDYLAKYRWLVKTVVLNEK
ncbi:MAG: triacylglycerol lipase [Thermoanaerobaculia bacterium]|jgi:triacylglycerol lipase|nr:triacylglycerol lipase [Thermoanaerobaculia bacterium]